MSTLECMDIVERIVAEGGIVRRAELVTSAADRRQLRRRLAEGAVRDLGRGWLAVPAVAPSVIAARRWNATITCVSAAPYYELAQLTRPARTHLAVPRSRGVGRVAQASCVHRESLWTPPTRGRVPLAPIGEVLARVLRCQPDDEAIVIVDSALNKRLITAEEVGRSLNGPGSSSALAMLDRCDPASRSPTETLARLALREAGLKVEAGAEIDGVGEVDLLVEGWIVVECDGFEYHSRTREFREDRRRDRELVALGFVVLRFTWEDIISDPRIVVEAVRRVPRRAAIGVPLTFRATTA